MPEDRLLLIEDDAEIASMYRLGLEAAGWRVRVERDGESGLAAALEWLPDVIVLDVMLPILNGIDVLRGLRAEGATARCPVVILSNAAGLAPSVDEASRLGVVDWMVKSRTAPGELAVRLAAFRRRSEGPPD